MLDGAADRLVVDMGRTREEVDCCVVNAAAEAVNMTSSTAMKAPHILLLLLLDMACTVFPLH